MTWLDVLSLSRVRGRVGGHFSYKKRLMCVFSFAVDSHAQVL